MEIVTEVVTEIVTEIVTDFVTDSPAYIRRNRFRDFLHGKAARFRGVWKYGPDFGFQV